MGLTRGVVESTVDPTGEHRVQVTIPSAGRTLWAARVFPLAAFGRVELDAGAEVWVAYEDDAPDLPVVVGTVRPPDRRAALGRDREAMGDAWDQGHAAGESDLRAATDTANPYR